MVTTLLDVGKIHFTQELVFDSFNANDERAGGVMELINDIISGARTPLDLPLIRVAAKKGVYWCVDNRRLFVYKHCQLGEIPVQVFGWKDNREFELKWRNGRASREKTGNGTRVGMVQRTDAALPRSPVMEASLTKVQKYLSPKQQRRHDAGISALRDRRKVEGTVWCAVAASTEESSASECKAIRELLQPGEVGPRPMRKRARRAELADSDRKPAAPLAPCRPSKRQKRAPAPLHVAESSNRSSGLKLTVTMGEEDSSDEAYTVEVTAPK